MRSKNITSTIHLHSNILKSMRMLYTHPASSHHEKKRPQHPTPSVRRFRQGRLESRQKHRRRRRCYRPAERKNHRETGRILPPGRQPGWRRYFQRPLGIPAPTKEEEESHGRGKDDQFQISPQKKKKKKKKWYGKEGRKADPLLFPFA